MLRSVPYDLFVSEATNSTVKYLHFIHTDQALALLAQRQPIVLSQIKAAGLPGAGSVNPGSVGVAGAVNLRPLLPLHVLYTDAIAFPATQQFANKAKEAADSYAELESELESALPTGLFSEVAMYIAEKRRQYLLLGSHLPALDPFGSLLYPGAPTPDHLNTWFGYATVLLIFPDWCGQCVAMGFNSTNRAKELLDTFHVRFLPLLARANPPEKRSETAIKTVPLPVAKSIKAAQSLLSQEGKLHVDQQLAMKSTPDSLLEGTQTIVVPNETLDAFAATDFPLIVAADHNGIIRTI
jgi:hypothetical protein